MPATAATLWLFLGIQFVFADEACLVDGNCVDSTAPRGLCINA
jgi:hypothetical protein